MAKRRIMREQEIRDDEEFGEAIPAASTGWMAETTMAEERPLAAAVIAWVAIAVESVLLLRFLLRIFAANPANAFVSFIYELSRPLVAPFFGALGVELNTGAGAFESSTVLAMLVYGLLAYILVAAINAASRRRV